MTPNIAIVGAGRFGKYLAQQLAPTQKVKPLEEKSNLKTLQTADITILCVPIRNTEECIQTVLPHLKENSLLMDVCSVKILPCQWLAAAAKARPDLKVCGSHPLFGPQSAPRITPNETTALCPVTTEIPKEAINFWQDILQSRIFVCRAKDHDKQMATQVLNHFIGRATAKMGVTHVQLSTKTHELYMRIQNIVAKNSDELFEDMNHFNPQAAAAREAFLNAATRIHKSLQKRENQIPSRKNT